MYAGDSEWICNDSRSDRGGRWAGTTGPMETLPIQGALRSQFGASIQMLENAIDACPAGLWSDRGARPEFWYLAYHTLFWLDLYLTGTVQGFESPAPFGLEELDPAGVLPERPYRKDELQSYLRHCQGKCARTIEAMDAERAAELREFPWGTVSLFELHLYNLRHVQHGAAQLNLLLRQATDSAPRWVARGR